MNVLEEHNKTPSYEEQIVLAKMVQNALIEIRNTVFEVDQLRISQLSSTFCDLLVDIHCPSQWDKEKYRSRLIQYKELYPDCYRDHLMDFETIYPKSGEANAKNSWLYSEPSKYDLEYQLPSEEQQAKLGTVLKRVFEEIIQVSMKKIPDKMQIFKLSDAFHILPKEMYGIGGWNFDIQMYMISKYQTEYPRPKYGKTNYLALWYSIFFENFND